MKNILITGADGQMGNAWRVLAANYPQYSFIYTDSAILDICQSSQITTFFEKYRFVACLNAAAYTAVDKAETDSEKAFLVNAQAVSNLSTICQQFDALLLHLSTDFVFDGKKSEPYTETDPTNPLSIYGRSKLLGEQEALKNPRAVVVRTSWLYSHFGHNFVKTMVRLGNEKSQLNVVFDQIGSPTNASDLAAATLLIINDLINENSSDKFGIYHYSNEGVASWYDFAHAIFDYNALTIKLQAIRSQAFPTPATRPAYSVMDKSKIKNTFQIDIPHWRDSLRKHFSA